MVWLSWCSIARYWCLAFWSLNQLCKNKGLTYSAYTVDIYSSEGRQEKQDDGRAPLVRVYSHLFLSLPLSHIVSLQCSCSCSWKWRENSRDETLNPCRASSRDYGFWTSNNSLAYPTSCSAKVSAFSFWVFCFHPHRRMNGRELEGMTSFDLHLLHLQILRALLALTDQKSGPRWEQVARQPKEVKF